MAFDSKDLDDYIGVAGRIAAFRERHPEGSLQPLNPEQPFEIREIAGADKNGKEQRGTFIIYTAAAYRSPDDQRPGVGCAYEVFPGRTPYTAGSELQNAETAAWGRAIVATLAADTRAGVSSQQEVRNRQAERGDSAGDVFEQSTPTRPNGNGNGAPRGQVARPTAPAAPGPDAEIDPEAQALADDAHACRSVTELRTRTYTTAQQRQKLNAFVADPATGLKGQLGPYLNFRKKVLEDLDAAWKELNAAAGKHRTNIAELENELKIKTGVNAEAATAAQIREFIASLGKAAAA